jgi:hypothetical protein
LQSLELPGAAELEGFAQYYSSKVWNNPGPNCGFAYYKEFLWPIGQCPAGATCQDFGAPAVGLVEHPPVAVSCKAPRRWRNTNCVTPAFQPTTTSTEFDWMSFLYNLDTTAPTIAPGAPPIPPLGLGSSTGIFGIYTTACGGAKCDSTNLSFADFSKGAETLYGLNDPRSNYVVQLGNVHGVSTSLTP